MELSGQIIKHGDDGNSRAIVPEFAAELGKELNTAAIQKRVAVKKHSLIACVEDFHRQQETLQQRITECTARIEQLNARLEDVQNGNFAVTEDARIIFPHLPAPHIG